jgi:uncharacterized protein
VISSESSIHLLYNGDIIEYDFVMTSPSARLAPLITHDNEGFWSAATNHRLVAQRCVDCHQLRHPPRPMCPNCHSLEHEWVELTGFGELYSYAILHHPRHPAFQYPLIAALVDLNEGIRMVSSLVDVDPQTVVIGMPLQVAYAPAEDGSAVPVFRCRDEA